MEGTRNTLPRGYKFDPSPEEVIEDYLVPKIKDANFITHDICEIDVNKLDLQENYSMRKEGKKWFYHKPCNRYSKGVRINRGTNSGYWKSTGKDAMIYKRKDKLLIGKRKTLVFKPREASNGKKTEWAMKEYRIEGNAYPELTAKEPWVVVSITKSEGKKRKGKMNAISPVASMEASENLVPYCNCEANPSPFVDVVPETQNEGLQMTRELLVPNYSTRSNFQSEQHLTVQDPPNLVPYSSPIETPASNASDYDMQLMPSVSPDTTSIVHGGSVMASDEHHFSLDNPNQFNVVTSQWIPIENHQIGSTTPIYSPPYSWDYTIIDDIYASGDGLADSTFMQESPNDSQFCFGFGESSSVGMARSIEQSRQDMEGNMEDQRLLGQVDRWPNDPDGTATPWVDGDWVTGSKLEKAVSGIKAWFK